jgi:hypothetical protein
MKAEVMAVQVELPRFPLSVSFVPTGFRLPLFAAICYSASIQLPAISRRFW